MQTTAKAMPQTSEAADSTPASMLSTQILQAAIRPNVTVNELVTICQNDPAFVVRLLAHVNSGRYVLRAKITSVQQGVSLLGVRGVRNLALATAVADLAPTNPEGDNMLALCLRRGIAGRLVAEKLGKSSPDDYFTLGMLAEVGLISRVREDHNSAVQLARAPAAMRPMLERGRGFDDHPTRGANLVRAWGLDADFSSAIQTHHDANPPSGDLARVIWLAERIAAVMEGGDASANRVEAINAAKHLNLTTADMDAILKALPDQLVQTTSELNRGLPPQPDIELLMRDANAALIEINRSYADLVAQLEAVIKDRERLAEELQQANKQLSMMAMSDPLTGLPNRRAFEEALVRDLARTERQGGSLTLILVDADHFKKVNDTYGHQGGDTVLRALSDVLRESTRSSDVAARVGGEEFALILPQTDADNALVVAERVRMRFAVRKIVLDDGRVVKATVSLGMATAKSPGCRGVDKALYEAADKALYAAKASGRNCVHTSPDQVSAPQT
jgi:two-component system, cell cycle response regulator